MLSLKKYSLLPEQKIMLENLISMFRSEDIDTINFARQLVLNEPLLNIIVDKPVCKRDARTLHNIVSHCKYKNKKPSGFYGGFMPRKSYVQGVYKILSNAMEYTVDYGYYYMYE